MAAVALTLEQRQAFARDGFVVVPSVVDRGRVDAALQAINHWLDGGYDSTRRSEYHARSYAPELAEDPLMVGLLTDTDAWEIVTGLIGRPVVCPTGAQMALRFPVRPGTSPSGPWPHIDGVPTADNGVPFDGRLHGFTALAGVLLSDLSQAGHGNFTVWPGSHLAMARWFRERGVRVDDPDRFFRESAAVAAETSDPVAVTGRAGDLVVAHYLLMHGVGAHSGPHIRYAVFFRLSCEDRETFGDRLFTDAWAEWDAMRPLATPQQGAVTRPGVPATAAGHA